MGEGSTGAGSTGVGSSTGRDASTGVLGSGGQGEDEESDEGFRSMGGVSAGLGIRNGCLGSAEIVKGVSRRQFLKQYCELNVIVWLDQ